MALFQIRYYTTAILLSIFYIINGTAVTLYLNRFN